MMNPTRFIFIGAPGVGKGTFAQIISQRYNWKHFSLGEHLRKETQEKTPLGLQIAPLLSAGKLVPDSFVNSIVLNTLLQYDKDNNSFILDGFPRSVEQANILDSEYVRKFDRKLVAVNITLNEEITIQKLLGRRICSQCKQSFNVAHVVHDSYDMPAILPDQSSCPERRSQVQCMQQFVSRDDDSHEIIQHRLHDYQSKIDPLLEFYRSKNALVSFEVHKGVKDVEKLFAAMTSHR